MMVFRDYARYYDLLYRDKDYRCEVDFVSDLLRCHAPDASSILELGCGTGRHAGMLAELGYRVHGIDRSEEMLADARLRRGSLAQQAQERLTFSCADIRSMQLPDRFDAVMALFHVISYLTDTADLHRVFASARQHLKPGGLFLFDCWYGPAVLHDPPSVRVKRLADQELEITRIAEPVMHPNENVVDVNYDVQVFYRESKTATRFIECHSMRYLFHTEIRELFFRHGMTPVLFQEWLTGKEPGFSSWNVCAGAVVPLP